MPDKTMLDAAWVLLCAGLVFLMQAGFMCLESGSTRAKNSINVAVKNLTDIGISVAIFWAFGFALMFGTTQGGWIGTSGFFPDVGQAEIWTAAIFVFQAMFCGAAITIVSGAVAERMRFAGYLMVAILLASLIYPLFGHWAWNGGLTGDVTGWLGRRGFVDFAGATVVHSVAAWVALATVLCVGPREGRFPPGEPPQKITGHNLPVAMLGTVLLWFGWFGFNGGSALAMDEQVPGLLANTLLAGASGMVAALAIGWPLRGRPDVDLVINGSLAGLVAITASCNVVTSAAAVVIGAVGGAVMFGIDRLLERWRIDDVVGAFPVHGGAGVWGTIAVALFGKPELMATGLSWWGQLWVQILGVGVCCVWAFGVAYLVLRLVQRVVPLRVTSEQEHIGLNVAEHGATTQLLDLLMAMERQEQTGDLSLRVPVEPFTEVGQIAALYNRVMEALQNAVRRTETIVRDIRDGIITFTREGVLTSVNPGAEQIFGYVAHELLQQPATRLFALPNGGGPVGLEALIRDDAISPDPPHTGGTLCGRRKDQALFPVEFTVTQGQVGQDIMYTGLIRDISERQQAEAQATQYLAQLEDTLRQLQTTQDQVIVQEKLASLGALTAGIAHEMRNPLNFVTNFAALSIDLAQELREELTQLQASLERETFDDIEDIVTSLEQNVARIREHGQRADRIVHNMLQHSRGQPGSREPTELNLLLREYVDLAYHGWRAQERSFQVTLDLDLDPALSLVNVVPQDMGRVFLNLLNNAFYAIHEKAQTVGDSFAPQLTVQTLDQGDRIAVRIRDNGNGVPP
ncbi:MAG: ammonium transporter, partial [Candidatus Tectomicrobia bacterium]|nr:ammonium transporter [Candidatus Tectomicrobia bacterium]